MHLQRHDEPVDEPGAACGRSTRRIVADPAGHLDARGRAPASSGAVTLEEFALALLDRPDRRAPTRRSSSPRRSLAWLKEREPKQPRHPRAARAPGRRRHRRPQAEPSASRSARRCRASRPCARPRRDAGRPAPPARPPRAAPAPPGDPPPSPAPSRRGPARRARSADRWPARPSLTVDCRLMTDAALAHRARPRHPRLPRARHRVQGHHPAAGRRRRLPLRGRRPGRRSSPARPIDRVLGIEARGFIFAAPVAYRLGAGFVPVRKPGKLPCDIEQRGATSSSTAPTPSRSTATPCTPGERVPDRRRRARHRRHRGGHRPAGRAARRRGRRARRS